MNVLITLHQDYYLGTVESIASSSFCDFLYVFYCFIYTSLLLGLEREGVVTADIFNL